MARVCCGCWQKIWTEIVAMIMSALILISVGCFLMLDWSLKERAHCRSFPVVLQAQLFEGTGDSSTDFADLEPMRTKELSVLPAVFLNYRCNRRNLWIYREEIRR